MDEFHRPEPWMHFKYPFEEFEENLKAVTHVSDWTDTGTFGELCKSDLVADLLANTENLMADTEIVLKYFRDSYDDRAEGMEKYSCFSSIHAYIGVNARFFQKKKLLEKAEGEKCPPAIYMELYRAVHFTMTFMRLPVGPGVVDPKLVAKLAKQFIAFYSAKPKKGTTFLAAG